MEIEEKSETVAQEAEIGGESECADEDDIARLEVVTDEESVEDGKVVDDIDVENELRAINEVCGSDLGTLEELPDHERYLKLRASGLLSVKEALCVVNFGELPRRSEKLGGHDIGAEREDTRGHLSSVRNKESGGEVFTRAEREELALWGIESTGAELERLWRRAGMKNG